MRIALPALITLFALAACSAPETPELSTKPPLVLTPDLEGTQIKGLAMPRQGLLTAGQPTEAQFEQLGKLGVKRVICLRPDTEPGTGWEEVKAKQLGITFVRLPIAGADGLTPDNARRLGQELAAAGDATAMVCCGSSNRVGALLALHAFFVEQKSAAEALAFGKAAGLKALEPQVKERLK
ncbi:MAG: sulfur transferase domain-containing protein [Planctomycetes bacterium]|jgi:uncharacterized protein (TIGR01244 family)|nr:sulfur transferase domain-containing protein [Planctomycetota bacterium]